LRIPQGQSGNTALESVVDCMTDSFRGWLDFISILYTIKDKLASEIPHQKAINR
jgi:hypothetical protein